MAARRSGFDEVGRGPDDLDDRTTRRNSSERTVGLDRRIGRKTRRQPSGKGRR